MAYTINIPLVNPNEPDALIIDIFVQEGQALEAGDLICTLETTKSTMDMAAEREGFISGIRYQEGDRVTAGDVFAYISEDPNWEPGPENQASDDSTTDSSISKLRISQPALLLAQKHGLDLAKLPEDVFITREMVQAVLSAESDVGTTLSGPIMGPSAVIIYGAGGHGKSILDLLRIVKSFEVVGFIDDGVAKGEIVMGVPVLGDRTILADVFDRGIQMAVNAVGGIGNIRIRETVFNRILQVGFTCPTVIHPTAFVEASATISAGSQVFPFAYVGSEVQVGFGSIVNSGAIVSHECRLGELVNIAPKATLAGEVVIGDGVLVGMGVTINLSVKVGAGARIGNGATVKADVPANGLVPAGSIWPN